MRAIILSRGYFLSWKQVAMGEDSSEDDFKAMVGCHQESGRQMSSNWGLISESWLAEKIAYQKYLPSGISLVTSQTFIAGGLFYVASPQVFAEQNDVLSSSMKLGPGHIFMPPLVIVFWTILHCSVVNTSSPFGFLHINAHYVCTMCLTLTRITNSLL